MKNCDSALRERVREFLNRFEGLLHTGSAIVRRHRVLFSILGNDDSRDIAESRKTHLAARGVQPGETHRCAASVSQTQMDLFYHIFRTEIRMEPENFDCPAGSLGGAGPV